MTTNRDRGALRAASVAAGPLATGPPSAEPGAVGPFGATFLAAEPGAAGRLSHRVYLIGLAGRGVTRRDRHGLPVAVGPHPGPRPACTVTPYREERCLLMPRYAQPGRS